MTRITCKYGSLAGMALLLGGCSGGLSGIDIGSGSASSGGATGIAVPTAVATSLRFTDLAVGMHHACGVTADGTVYCWGSNEYGQLGSTAPLAQCDNGATPCSTTPVPVAAPVKFKNVGASLRDSCAVSVAGEIWCWGYGEGGQLGDGLATNSEQPVKVLSTEVFSSVHLGGSGLIACALTATDVAWCWGPGGGGGGLGNGTTDRSNTPVPVAGALAFAQLTVGDEHACGLSTSGPAYCWGHNLYGSLGQGFGGASSVPSPVAGGYTFTALSAGLAHTCGLVADGSAYCWGFPQAVGSPAVASVLSPLVVGGAGRFTKLSAGSNHSCALDANGAAWCWGLNLTGELGDGSYSDRVAPVKVSTPERFAEIRAGGSTCALNSSGVAFCWGANNFGQAGQPP